jgi:hypothetical protein
VLLRIAPGAAPQAASVSVSVWAVAAGTLVPVADWDLPDDGAWAEGDLQATETAPNGAVRH